MQTIEGKRWCGLLEESGRIPRDLPREQTMACFRMLTGHDFLQKHLHRIGVKDSPTCPLCLLDMMTGEHLDTCPTLQDIRCSFNEMDSPYARRAKLYWTARAQDYQTYLAHADEAGVT